MSEENGPAAETVADPRASVWLWVLTAPITKHRDKILILEDKFGDYTPFFLLKDEAQTFLQTLDPEGQMEFQSQAIHIFDLEALAKENNFRLLRLDSRGVLVGQWNLGATESSPVTPA
ncbi:MAG: hypothetical protein LBR11_02905 [Deltaproteobacteria bacterium]|nr:hypothetical protein [Deltaproteobacteria bacterium]